MEGDTIKLRDGRNLGFCDYGKSDGIPVMLFHGTPGSRVFGRFDEAAWVEEFGLRVITPERPGFGLSDPSPGRTIADWAGDVVELADALHIDRYHVAGGSGGGPYTLACAIHSSQRVLSATLFSSGGPPQVMPITKDMQFGNRLAFFGARYAPFFLRLLIKQTANAVKKHPGKIMAKMAEKLPEADRRVFTAKNAESTLRHLQEAYRQGTEGTCRDIHLVARDWGLDFSAIKVPVFLWHGNQDTLVPVSTAHGLARLIPGCEAHFIPEAGHGLLGDDEVAAQMMGRLLTAGA